MRIVGGGTTIEVGMWRRADLDENLQILPQSIRPLLAGAVSNARVLGGSRATHSTSAITINVSGVWL